MDFTLNIDTVIFLGFLIINLAVGLAYGHGIKNIKEYAIGNRNFSTATLASTIIATWISGSFFAIRISDTYKQGIWITFAGVGDAIALLIIGYIFGPRMREFLGNISVAEVMGNLYGKNIRYVTAICAVAQAIGMTALQIKVFSSIFSYFLNFSNLTATLVSSFVVIFYSAFGGIRAVTFTDVIQFLTFGIFIPIFALFIWKTFGDTYAITHTFQTNPLFDYGEILNYKNPNFLPYLFLFLYTCIPGVNSTLFQRTLMAKNTKQITQSFAISGAVSLFIHLFACFIGIVVFSNNSTLDPNNIVMHVIDNYSFPGLRGVAIIAVMAMIMSTADSWINTASVTISHDLCKPLGVKFNELLISKISAVLVGGCAIFLALQAKDLLKLVLLTANFYKPVVTVPLILAILGFRSTTRAVSIGMIAGGSLAWIWKFFITPITSIDSVVPAMTCNLIVYMGAHYLLGEAGGWIKKSYNYHTELPKKEISFIKNAVNNLSVSNIIIHCNQCTPKQEITYYYFAFASLLTVIVSFSIDKLIYQQNMIVINTLQIIALFIGVIFAGHKLFWPEVLRRKYVGIIWYISIFTNLAFISSLLVLISKFSHVSLVVLILHFAIIGMLLSWEMTLLMIIVGIVSAFYIYITYIGEPMSADLYDLKLKAVYLIFMLSSFLLAFLKPKQEYQRLTEEKNEHLNDRIDGQEKELREALALRSRFIRNIEHEYHAPMTNIISNAELLKNLYDKLTDEERRQSADIILQNAARINCFDNNIAVLSRISKEGYNLNIKPLNLTALIYDRAGLCRKLYEEKNEATETREFILNIEEDINITGDKTYLTYAFDNLIINSIDYCPHGKITLELKQRGSEVVFTISDEGIGIPPLELQAIFDEFVVSSKTATIAGGRGIGLTVAKRIIEAHGGKIEAESDGIKGSVFKIILGG